MEQKNFYNQTCCQTYCPCCPECDCDCRCTCNCSKKKMIIPTFFFSFICFILIIIGMITKSTDTSIYKNFKTIYKDNNNNENNIEKILDIEKNEDNYTLTLLIIGGIILLIYLVLMICFLNEKTCFENYNPKCKVPYYLVLMFVNFILNYVNAIFAFVFCGYRSDTIDDYTNFFSENNFKNNNDLNLILEIIIGIFYLAISIMHLFVYYYLFKEDQICLCCCQSVLDCMNCCRGCIKCLCCCCCCLDCTEIPSSNTYNQPPVQTQQQVVIVQQSPQMPVNNNTYNNNVYNNNMNNAYNNNNNNNGGILDRIKNLLPGNAKSKVDKVCNKSTYNNSFAQFSNCVVCGNMFQIGQEILILPCGHICHSNCGYNWFENNKNCPSDGLLIIN